MNLQSDQAKNETNHKSKKQKTKGMATDGTKATGPRAQFLF